MSYGRLVTESDSEADHDNEQQKYSSRYYIDSIEVPIRICKFGFTPPFPFARLLFIVKDSHEFLVLYIKGILHDEGKVVFGLRSFKSITINRNEEFRRFCLLVSDDLECPRSSSSCLLFRPLDCFLSELSFLRYLPRKRKA